MHCRIKTTMGDSSENPIRFRLATEEWEFEQIHRLNYETFVEEIPQHAPNPQRRLVDSFHDQNTYAIAVRGATVIGMAALRGQRPFSLDKKLSNLDTYLPKAERICEVRLLATLKDSRTGLVFRGLANLLVGHALEHKYEIAIISGALKQVPLYKRLGFVPFGPEVGTKEAPYQPMYYLLKNLWLQDSAFLTLKVSACGHGETTDCQIDHHKLPTLPQTT